MRMNPHTQREHDDLTRVNDVSYCNPPDLEPKIALPLASMSHTDCHDKKSFKLIQFVIGERVFGKCRLRRQRNNKRERQKRLES
jgi:hypothetical protein